MASADLFVAGLVLAAGGSSRLGQPKQLLPFGPATLLDHTLTTARECQFEQLLVAIGGAADDVRTQVDLSGTDVVVNDAFGEGCSSSIAAAMGALDSRADALVLLLGDQPGISIEAILALAAGSRGHAVGVCSYDDAPGHPLWFDRSMFDTLRGLHGDKAVWKLVGSGGDVVSVAVPGDVPLDVDTWDDYRALLAGE